jgi:hypothetical protein
VRWVGVRWTFQLVPFHCSANVPVGLPEASNEVPIAMQAKDAGQATP